MSDYIYMLVCAYLGTLIQIAAYTTFSEHDYIDISEQFENNTRMFQHRVSRKTCIIIHTIKSVTRDATIAKVFKVIGQQQDICLKI